VVLFPMGYRGSLPGLNWAGCEVNDWHPSNPEVSMELYLCPPPICLHNVAREKFIVEFVITVCSVKKFVINLALQCMYQLSNIYFLY